MHDSARAGIERIPPVHRAAVIPQHEIAGAPDAPPHVPVLRGIRPDFIEQGFGLREPQSLYIRIASTAEIDQPAAGLGVRADERVVTARRIYRIIDSRDSLANVTTAVVGPIVFEHEAVD